MRCFGTYGRVRPEQHYVVRRTVQTGRGRIDLLIIHNQRKYIVETKMWEGVRYYEAGKNNSRRI